MGQHQNKVKTITQSFKETNQKVFNIRRYIHGKRGYLKSKHVPQLSLPSIIS